MDNLIGRAYYSREDRVGELNNEFCRVQYDDVDDDIKRIGEAYDAFDVYSEELCEAVEQYMDAMQETGEDAASIMGYSRRELIEKWALAQATLSKIAWVLRVDGNDAYQRMINALRTGDAVDMRGL